MNSDGLAYATLREMLEDWADENHELIRYGERFARQVADYVFDELLDIPVSEIDNEG